MVLNPARLSDRQKLILTGLFLSKYDAVGLKDLGFRGFVEAFNVIGFALGAKPASIKNYRDEFDPLFKHRKGWHKRPRRDYCLQIFDDYKKLDFKTFSALVQSFFAGSRQIIDEDERSRRGRESSFAKRLTTGLAAERYFESVLPQLSEFSGYTAENTTLLGCGYDFQLTFPAKRNFLAVEIKGLANRKGSLSLTEKEHQMALTLKDRFYLFVVKNFAESPFHEIYQNPLSGISFDRREQVVVQCSWVTAL